MAQKHAPDADVIVIGGGLAGMSLTALLAAHGLSVICIDRDDPARLMSDSYDIRTTAISFGSQRVLAAAGAWDESLLRPCAIRDIRVLDGNAPLLLNFISADAHGQDFGWIVDNRALRQSLYNRLTALDGAHYIAPAMIDRYDVTPDHAAVYLADGRRLSAPVIIGADGRQSATRAWMNIPVRRWSYHQQAIVCSIWHRNPHNHIAVEHFLPAGPFAVLPMQDDADGHPRSALVWSEHTHRTGKKQWDDPTFIAALNAQLPDFYGGVTRIGPRAAFALNFSHAYRYIGPRMALVADAAHAIHPIAGQGLNIGLRDIAALAELLIEAKEAGKDLGADDLLQTYQRQRRFDNTLMAAATDALNRVFANDSKVLGAVRKAGLKAVQHFAPARRFFMRQAMGAPSASHLPRLIREGRLR